MNRTIEEAVTGSLGTGVRATRRVATGHNAELVRVVLADGRVMMAKLGGPGARLDLEGFMLRQLAERSRLPVPRVHYVDAALLLMDFIAGGGAMDGRAEEHAADLLADLHAITASKFGFPCDTLIGPLPQPNGETDDWIGFFRDQRLLTMARAAHAEGRLPGPVLGRLDRLGARLPELLSDPNPPALIHGDAWGGNILVRDGRVMAFIDPALYHADPEIELAFVTLFATVGDRFFRRYAEHRRIKPGFFEVRRDLYNLYPLLVHVRLFGGGYLDQVDQTVRRLI